MTTLDSPSAALSATFAALADPTRRGILERLSTGEATVTELAAPLSMSLPAVSKHLRVLESAGLLDRRRDGRTHHLRLNPAPMRAAREWIDFYRRFWESSLDQLADYLERGAEKNREAPENANRPPTSEPPPSS
ncbi:MAG: winged helix-turn-helix transcriptional regulator [Verrucomicrobiae bacterium]|nr:winged helix-turn-helix transcriptional regulator [Verrucomicrobiae bacterium]MCP5550531.1 winged helix-turn-helix transcriptional regulator [Akkermansiaceae bacterium]